MPPSPRSLALCLVGLSLFGALTPDVARAHSPKMSAMRVDVLDDALVIDLAVHSHSINLAVGLDSDGDQTVSVAEVEARREEIARYIGGRLQIRSRDRLCEPTLTELEQREHEQVLRLQMRYRCAELLGEVVLENRILTELIPDHQFLGLLTEEGREHTIGFSADSPHVTYQATPPPTPEAPNPTPAAQTDPNLRPPASQGEAAWRFFVEGVEHILYEETYLITDHLLFVLLLLLVVRSFGALLLLITGFTLAHSTTLALASLGWVTPSAVWVEAIIAASIVAVAAENVFWEAPRLTRGEPASRHRLAIVVGFGLVHGFGFAGSLSTLLWTQHTLTALVTFNLGVEVGQIAVVALLWPLLRRAMEHKNYHHVVTTLSTLGGALALWWLYSRCAAA